ncbi:MAG: serine protease Do, partial [Paracoccaceae bacterium]
MIHPSSLMAAGPGVARTGIARLARGVAMIAAALMITLVPVTQAVARGAPESFADLAEKLSPSVVNISTSQMVTPP